MFSVRNDICVYTLELIKHPHAWSTCDPKRVHLFISTLLVIFINIKIPGNEAFCLLAVITNLNVMATAK